MFAHGCKDGKKERGGGGEEGPEQQYNVLLVWQCSANMPVKPWISCSSTQRHITHCSVFSARLGLLWKHRSHRSSLSSSAMRHPPGSSTSEIERNALVCCLVMHVASSKEIRMELSDAKIESFCCCCCFIYIENLSFFLTPSLATTTLLQHRGRSNEKFQLCISCLKWLKKSYLSSVLKQSREVLLFDIFGPEIFW